MRAIRCVLAAVLAAGIVAVVTAQPGGGFRGGQIDVYTAVADNKALHEELKITDAQKEKFKGVAAKKAELDKKQSELFAKGFKDFDKDAFTKLGEDRTKLNEEIKKVADDTLNADQKKRLKQINIQVMGMTVFTDPESKGAMFLSDAQKATIKEVGEALKLTDSQKSTLKTITTEFGKDRTDIFKEAGIGGKGGGKVDPEKRDAANKKVAKLQKEALTKIEESLDATQKKTWKELVGEAFDTTKLNPPPAKKD